MRNYGRQDSRGECRNNYRNDSYGRSGNRSRDFPEIMEIKELEAQAIVDPGQDPEVEQIGIECIVIGVGNRITLQETVPLPGKKGKLNNFKECSVWVMNKQQLPQCQTCKKILLD